jgi:tetratricopeptide (TPR) repeat protein
MTISLVAGTLLATLSKESGLLLPAYVLVLEATLLNRPIVLANRTWRLWQSVLLLLPTVAIVVYLASRSMYPDWVVAMRDFTAWERLLTEAQLLWLYVYKALLGFPSHLGVFQAPPTVSHSILEPIAFLATASWLVLASASIAWRRRYPLMSVAVLWFLTGHIIESSVVPLELYFEHRNYLPIIGPLYALCAFLLQRADQLRRIAYVLVPLYILLSAYFLFGFASLSGEPSLASRYWALKYPDSARAVTTMATYQLSEEGPLRTLSTIDVFVIERPQFAYLRIQELNLRCMYLPDQDHDQVLEELRRELPKVDFTYTAGTMLSQLMSTVSSVKCNGVGLDTVAELARTLQSNPRYVGAPLYNQFHHKLMAGIARQQGDYDATIDHLDHAIALQGSGELNMMMVTALGGAGDFDGANEFIDAALRQQPLNPLQALVWRSDLEKLRDYVNELERYSLGAE